jgi:Outer membrane protein beta-barrel domain
MKALHLRTIALALLGTLSACAPGVSEARPFHITAMGGLTISKLRNLSDPYDIFESLKGFSAGVGLGWPLSGSLEIQPEVLYIQKGVSFGESEGADDSGNPIGSLETLHVVDAVEVPLLLRLQVPMGGRLHPVLVGGPFVSFEVAERLKTTGALESSEDSQILKNTDYGVVLGAGLELEAGPGRWILQGRYEPGLADLGSFYTSNQVHSNAWVLTTGFRY